MITPSEVFNFNQDNVKDSRLDWVVPEDLPYFRGHFPNNPILPAVAITDASQEFLSILLPEVNRNDIAIIKGKFAAPIRPKDKLNIELAEVSDMKWAISWKKQEGDDESKLVKVAEVLLGKKIRK